MSLSELVEKCIQKALGKKIVIDLGGDLGSELRQLAEISGDENEAVVVQEAILQYHTLVHQKTAGNVPQILVLNDGPEHIVPIFQ